MSLFSALRLIALISLTPFILKYLIRLTFRCIGWSLQRKTKKRRELILSRVKSEEQAYQSGQENPQRSDDEDWEKIESYAAASAPNGDLPSDGDWEGVIGFFHPFWSVPQLFSSLTTHVCPAMQEAAEKEFFGQQ